MGKNYLKKACIPTGLIMGLSAPVSALQHVTVVDRFANAIQSVEEGIDLLWPDDGGMKDFSLRLGVGTGFVPDYAGSDNYRLRALPIIEIGYKDLWRLNGTNFTYNSFRHGPLSAGPLVNLNFGRSEDSNKALAGLGDIGTSLEIGAFARLKHKSLLVTADIRQALGAGQGRSLRFSAGHGIMKRGKFAMALALRAKLLSKKGMQTNFGITPEQAAASARGFDTFEADGGFSEMSVNLLGTYKLTDTTRFVSLLSVGQLLGSAKDSPIVNSGVGSSTQIIAGSALTFNF